MGATIEISRAALAAIRAHAAEEPEREVCGLLLGREGRIEEARRTANVAERPEDSFEIDPAALFAAIRAERAGGPEIIGWYHSHPEGSAEPSARDVMAAVEVGKVWVIVAGDQLGAWRVATEGMFKLELKG